MKKINESVNPSPISSSYYSRHQCNVPILTDQYTVIELTTQGGGAYFSSFQVLRWQFVNMVSCTQRFFPFHVFFSKTRGEEDDSFRSVEQTDQHWSLFTAIACLLSSVVVARRGIRSLSHVTATIRLSSFSRLYILAYIEKFQTHEEMDWLSAFI